MSVTAGTHDQLLALATLGRMVSTVAHEVRNLVGGIELYASLLADQQPDAATVAGRLLSGVTQLRALAANLLTVPRRAAADRVAVDAAALVAETVDSVALALKASGVAVRCLEPPVKALVLADPDRLRQALLNLVLNAVQAMPDGGRLTVSTRLGSGEVEIAVGDTGVGMDRQTLRRAMEPFFTTRASGTGLGLAVVRDFADAHGGRLALASRPGRGTTVRLALPLAPSGDPLTPDPAAGLARPLPSPGGAR